MSKDKVLFVCVHNSARSQMAEEILRKWGGDRFDVESAGLEPGELNPLVVDVLLENGIDIAGKKTQAVFDLFKDGRLYSYVITVCDETNAERCPVFPGVARRIHWSFEDPSRFEGSREEKMARTRVVFGEIRRTIETWLTQLQD